MESIPHPFSSISSYIGIKGRTHTYLTTLHTKHGDIISHIYKMPKCHILIMLAFTNKIERGSTARLLNVISVRLPTSDPPWCQLYRSHLNNGIILRFYF